MAGGWPSLTADLLNQISACLISDTDQLHVHQVCAHWRASTSPPAAFRPWVVAGRQAPNGRGPLGEYSLMLPRGVQSVDFAAAPSGLPYCCGTPRGWLALADDLRSPTRFVLWEPHSGTEIPLPCLCPVIQIFLSGDPLESSHWMAVASQPRGPVAHILFFWRPGDSAWSGSYCNNPQCGIPCREDILHRQLSESWAARKSARDYVCAVHVVACAGELLLVLLFNGHHPSLMEVYRPAWTPQWPFHVGERVTDLRGYTLFLGRGDAVALSAKEYPAIRGNCIYYLVHCVNTCTRRSLGQSCLIWGPMLWRISLTLRCKLRRMRVPTGGHTLGFVLKGLS